MAKPVVMSISGHDPGGGAGIQADIEAITSQSCHPVSVMTCITVQDTHGVYRVEALPDYLILQQAEALLSDMQVATLKFGLLGSLEAIRTARVIIKEAPSDVPVVLDPILALNEAQHDTGNMAVDMMREYILPHTNLITPNKKELARLSGLPNASITEQAKQLQAYGCHHVLVKDVESDHKASFVNQLFTDGVLRRTWSWERLPHLYYGPGCTLASACAAQLAHQPDLEKALTTAQAYTWGSLEAGLNVGQGRRIPQRLYWSKA